MVGEAKAMRPRVNEISAITRSFVNSESRSVGPLWRCGMHIGGLRSDNLYCKFGDLSRGTGRREIAFVRAASGFPLPFGNLRRFSKCR